MNNPNVKKINLTSSNLSEDKLAELRRLLPEAFSENKIDWEKLRTVLGDEVDSRIEKFSFSWAGKSNAIKNVLIPSKATLTPVKDKGVKHDDSENLFIEGDNLEVLKLLQKAYFEKVKMIYIDPPYNTGGDFVYSDNFASPLKNYLEQTGQKDSEGNSLQTNKETNGRYHSDWLSMMYPRLKLAWNLLRDDGVIFVSIDDNEAHRLRMVMDEIFGEENFVAQIEWQKRYTRSNNTDNFTTVVEHILLYQKTESFTPNLLARNEEADGRYTNPDKDPRGEWKAMPFFSQATPIQRPNLCYEILNPNNGKVVTPQRKAWRSSKDVFEEYVANNQVYWGKDGNSEYPSIKKFLSEAREGMTPINFWSHDFAGNTDDANYEIKDLFKERIFDTPKPTLLIRRMLEVATNPNENNLVLDFFAGSGTTAHAVLKQNLDDDGNRKFILIQLPEATNSKSEAFKAGYKTISDITQERIRRVLQGYGDTPEPMKDGFKVFKLAESNYPENTFEFDHEKSEEENKTSFEEYLTKAKQPKLMEEIDEIGLVYENIIKEGFSLNSKIREQKIAENKVYGVIDGERQLSICLDSEIGEKMVSELTGKEYKGKVFICFDNALNDSAKANLGLNVELKTI
jgi:adenine-specific DNA-methyltransferase